MNKIKTIEKTNSVNDVISILRSFDPNSKVGVLLNNELYGISKDSSHSHLIHENDLAVSPTSYDGPYSTTTKEFLEMLENSERKAYRGAHGGTFSISKNSPLWFARFGSASELQLTTIVNNHGNPLFTISI